MPEQTTPDLVVEALIEEANNPLRHFVCSSLISIVAALAEGIATEISLIIPAGLCDDFQNDAQVQVRAVNNFPLAERTIKTITFKPIYLETDGIMCEIDDNIIIIMRDDRVCLDVQLEEK